ncbi:MAG: HD domain-containing protein [Planctomycetota bacterium]
MPELVEFQRLWRELALPVPPPNAPTAAPSPVQVFSDLRTRYSEPHRYYHNFAHIDQCLQYLAEDEAAGRCSAPRLMAAAIWFHDAVYDTHATDNEAQSARLAGAWLPLPPAQAAVVEALILDTRHQTPPATADGRLLADIDLAGIGASAEGFALGCAHIRQEYGWVPADEYRTKRARFLQTLLDRPQIYFTPTYRERFEAGARRNLAQELRRLAQPETQ